jgi:tRNA-Thr(GGU) m(6)t(6)A37 methyltransferase TsaA
MQSSRRRFLAGAAGLGLTGSWAAQAAEAAAGDRAEKTFTLRPVGVVEKKKPVVRVRIFDEYREALLGLDGWSHVHVFYWFDRNDTPGNRRTLRVHPQGNRDNPLTGVFACRAPFRPNLIALSVCRIASIDGLFVNLDDIDAFDGTPVLDLKPLTPPDAPEADKIRVPDWARNSRPRE